MSPDVQTRGTKTTAPSNLYTIILLVAFGIVLATAAFVAYRCYAQYGAVFKIP